MLSIVDNFSCDKSQRRKIVHTHSSMSPSSSPLSNVIFRCAFEFLRHCNHTTVFMYCRTNEMYTSQNQVWKGVLRGTGMCSSQWAMMVGGDDDDDDKQENMSIYNNIAFNLLIAIALLKKIASPINQAWEVKWKTTDWKKKRARKQMPNVWIC